MLVRQQITESGLGGRATGQSAGPDAISVGLVNSTVYRWGKDWPPAETLQTIRETRRTFKIKIFGELLETTTLLNR